ncbi:MAG: hypothetical protein PGN11_13185 [Quadrisphaera sp.]
MTDLTRFIDLLRPHDRRRAALPSELARPELSRVARAMAGRPAADVALALEEAVRAAGAVPDARAVAELAAEVERGRDPFRDGA